MGRFNIRAQLGLERGDKISFIVDERGALNFVPVTKNITTLKGLVAKPAKPAKPAKRISIDDMKATADSDNKCNF